MKQPVFIFPGNESIAKEFIAVSSTKEADFTFRNFPDGESYLKTEEDVRGKKCFLFCSLNNPDQKLTQLYLLSRELRNRGAESIVLLSPYLGYLRQDKRFSEGEILSSVWAGELISKIADQLVTIDPHLHRIKSLNEILSIPSQILSSHEMIGRWIKENITTPVIIGPDEESDQWARKTAESANCDFLVLKKTRKGDREVNIEGFETLQPGQTPVLVDDIISTARTMGNTVKQLIERGSKAPVCIGVHALFAEDAFDYLKQSGAEKIITCNTIHHSTNAISLGQMMAESLKI